MNDDHVDSNNIEELTYSDYKFFATSKPGCNSILRLYSIDFFFNGTKGSLDEEIYYTLIEPSLFIEMPTEEFYAKIDPKIGFKRILCKFRGEIIQ